MHAIRRTAAAVVAAVLLGGIAAAPAQAVTPSTTMYPSFRFCDYVPIFPGCQR